MSTDLTDQVIQNTKTIKAMQNQRRSSVVRTYGVEHTAEFVNGTATFYLPVDTDMEYMSELKFKLLSGTIGSSGTIDDPTGGDVEPGIGTYKTMQAWLDAFPVGTYVDMDGYYGAQSLVAGTQLLGADGLYYNVEDLKEGDAIFAKDGRTINTIASNKETYEEIWEVKTRNGYIRGTAGHKMFVNGERVELKDIKIGDLIDLPDKPIKARQCKLSPDTAKFIGFWYGCVNRVGRCVVVIRNRLRKYLESLNLDLRRDDAFEASVYGLYNNQAFRRFINKYGDGPLPILVGREKEVIEGFIHACGWKTLTGKIAAESDDFATLTAIQEMCWRIGYTATMGKVKGKTRVLTIEEKSSVRNEVLSVKNTHKMAPVYHTNVWEGNHSYIADGFASSNCWDYADAFWVSQVNRTLKTGTNHSAADTWYQNRAANALTEFALITDVTQIKKGDWLVLAASDRVLGHICLAAEDYNGTNSLQVYGQNQGGTPVPRGGAAISLETLTLTNFAGAFRYRGWTVD